MGALHLPAVERPDQLGLVVAGYGEGMARPDHPHRQSEDAGRVGPAIHQVAEEHHPPALWMGGVNGSSMLIIDDGIAKSFQQLAQLCRATVDVADHIERPALVAVVVEHPLSDDRGLLDLGDAGERDHSPESLADQRVDRLAQLLALTPDHVRTEVTVGPAHVAFPRRRLGDVQDDRDREHVVLAGQPDELGPRLLLHVGGVDHGEPARGQPLAGDIAEYVERRPGGGLVVLVIGHQPAAEVTGDGLEPAEVSSGEGGLAGATDADQHHQAHLGNAHVRHR